LLGHWRGLKLRLRGCKEGLTMAFRQDLWLVRCVILSSCLLDFI
jgi:hypothetical protein